MELEQHSVNPTTYQQQMHAKRRLSATRTNRRGIGSLINWPGVIRGVIVDMLKPIEAASRGWTMDVWYLVRPNEAYCPTQKPHWVRRGEIE